MLQDKTIKQKDYERASQLLGGSLKLIRILQSKSAGASSAMGRGVFQNLESFDFSADVFEKLDAVRLVLFGMGEK
jgi:hypothetical protein